MNRSFPSGGKEETVDKRHRVMFPGYIRFVVAKRLAALGLENVETSAGDSTLDNSL